MGPVIEILGSALILMMSIILHEIAHGLSAYKLGDPTAKEAGRLTLNPLKHIDPFGTLILPGILIMMRALGVNTVVLGWAKPVPVNFRLLNSPRRDMVLVAMAGPLVNILIAWLFSWGLKIDLNLDVSILSLIHFTVYVNLLLAVFNMMPIPPLDGSRLVSGMLPGKLAHRYNQLEPFGIFIVFGLLYFGLIDMIVFPVIRWIAQLWGISL